MKGEKTLKLARAAPAPQRNGPQIGPNFEGPLSRRGKRSAMKNSSNLSWPWSST